ncbi:putative enhancer of rudimentary [Polychytrium aggregatum]|uniref:putative enhancer of rudimentary n=1 Tax=Polychytrium aggregatum TaxID=110093 RepID=UPI0022FF000E|nr:putative enhancer of rudimentary [Polychytrium aggregatum]KAI9193737.1 putative enhancer of rudimentary [Polychytrium aggregatum]
MATHTILLIQKNQNKNSRTYEEFQTVDEAAEELIRMYEDRLKELNPNLRQIHYDVNDLNKWIDSIHDICGLVFNSARCSYEPHDREWLKSIILVSLKKAAGIR